MGLAEDLAASVVPESKVPDDWKPGIRDDGDTLSVTTGPLVKEPDRSGLYALLEEWGYDLDDWVLDEERTQRVGGHEMGFTTGEGAGKSGEKLKLRNFKFHLHRKPAGWVDADELLARFKRLKPAKAKKLKRLDATLVVALADWQAGSGEGGGTPSMITRIETAAEQTALRAEKVERVALVCLGDLLENCNIFPGQPYTLDLNQRDQLRVAVTLLFYILDLFVGLVPKLIIAAVPGNHGENRTMGRNTPTDPVRDNLDLVLFDNLYQICSKLPRFKDVTWIQPPSHDPACISVDCGSEPDGRAVWLGAMHGHVGARGGNPGQALQKWWDGQNSGERGSRPAQGWDVLLAGHRHHLLVQTTSGRTIVQAPAMDGGSEHYTIATGRSSPPGMLSFLLGGEIGHVPNNIQVAYPD